MRRRMHTCGTAVLDPIDKLFEAHFVPELQGFGALVQRHNPVPWIANKSEFEIGLELPAPGFSSALFWPQQIQRGHDAVLSSSEFGGRKNRIMAALYLLRPEERRRETGRRQFESYFKFGFVRNPWDRVVSLYERTEALQLRNEMSFEQFVDWIQYSSATCVHSSPHRYQLDWFVDANGNLLADFIGRFERLDEDWAFGAEARCGGEVASPPRKPPGASLHGVLHSSYKRRHCSEVQSRY